MWQPIWSVPTDHRFLLAAFNGENIVWVASGQFGNMRDINNCTIDVSAMQAYATHWMEIPQ
jgi:hypothetical protein